ERGEEERAYADLVTRCADLDQLIGAGGERLDQLRAERVEFERQLAVAKEAADRAVFQAKAAAHIDDGSEIAVLADALAARIAQFAINDADLSRLANRLGLYEPSPIANRLTFALSHHLFTDAIRRIVGGTRLELSVTFSRHRGGLSFAEIAVPPA